jgi:GTP cyclohydrolase IA
MSKQKIEQHFSEIMKLLNLDLTDDSLKDTPKRLAKMYVDELFSSLNQEFPEMMLVENKFNYNEPLIHEGIELKSMCEHHFMPFIGNAKITYVPNKRIIGLSKLNRVVEYFAKRPQIQERLTKQIHEKLVEILETKNVKIEITAEHYCIKMRGIKHEGTKTTTISSSGIFNSN